MRYSRQRNLRPRSARNTKGSAGCYVTVLILHGRRSKPASNNFGICFEPASGSGERRLPTTVSVTTRRIMGRMKACAVESAAQWHYNISGPHATDETASSGGGDRRRLASDGAIPSRERTENAFHSRGLCLLAGPDQ